MPLASRYLAVLTIATCISVPVLAQDAGSPIGLPVDWSFRHLIHTQPWNSATEAATRRDPRVLYNWVVRERHRPSAAPATKRHGPKLTERVDWNFTLGTGTVAANMSPAKFTFDVGATPSCTSDYVVFALNVAGSASQPNLVRLNNLYSDPTNTGFCSGTGPAVMSAYNVTTAGSGSVLTSPALSLDGTKVAFIESGTGSIFHVLTFGSTGSNGSFNSTTNTYTTAVPGTNNNAVMTSLSYSTAINTLSSPWIDYHNDVAYFGDDNGMLYQTTCAFACSAPPAIASGWPIPVAAAGVKLAAPVLDPTSNKIFVGGSDGKLYMVDLSICPTSCSVGPRPSLTVGSTATFGGIIDAPLVDTTFETVFAFAGDDGTGSGVVVQTNTTFNLVNPNSPVSMGSKPFYGVLSGAFDNTYFSNTPLSGNLYACGATGGSGQAALYQMGFSVPSGTPSAANPPLMGKSSHQNVPGNPGVGCSPLVEFLNGSDQLFLSQASLPSKKCVSTSSTVDGCVMMYTLSGSGPSVAPAASAVENNGTSSIIVDNSSADAQASSIYLSNEGTATCTIGAGTPAYCAIKLTQAALQ